MERGLAVRGETTWLFLPLQQAEKTAVKARAKETTTSRVSPAVSSRKYLSPVQAGRRRRDRPCPGPGHTEGLPHPTPQQSRQPRGNKGREGGGAHLEAPGTPTSQSPGPSWQPPPTLSLVLSRLGCQGYCPRVTRAAGGSASCSRQGKDRQAGPRLGQAGFQRGL